jgi:hypothetical protein
MNLIPTNKEALTTWLVDLSGNIAISGAGVAFLDAQITDLENKCFARRVRIGKERAGERRRRERLKATPKRDSNLKLGRSIGLLFQQSESWIWNERLRKAVPFIWLNTRLRNAAVPFSDTLEPLPENRLPSSWHLANQPACRQPIETTGADILPGFAWSLQTGWLVAHRCGGLDWSFASCAGGKAVFGRPESPLMKQSAEVEEKNHCRL